MAAVKAVLFLNSTLVSRMEEGLVSDICYAKKATGNLHWSIW